MRALSSAIGAAVLLALGASLMVAPVIAQQRSSGERLSFAASPYPVQFLASAIAGGLADEVALGDDPDTLLYVGGAEPELDRSAAAAARARDVAAGIDPLGTVNAPWLSVGNMDVMARAIVAEFSDLDPSNAELFRANADAAMTPVFRLQNDFATGTEICDVVDLTVNEPGYEHLAAAYGFRLVQGQEGPQLTLLLRAPPDGSNYLQGMTTNLAALMVSQQCQWPVVFGP